MPRAKSGTIRKHRVKNVLKKTKGSRGARSKLYRTAKNSMFKALGYAYVGRKQKKRQFRQLWIARISAACQNSGLNYSKFMLGLKKANIELNRKSLANLAIMDIETFNLLIEKAKSAIA